MRKLKRRRKRRREKAARKAAKKQQQQQQGGLSDEDDDEDDEVRACVPARHVLSWKLAGDGCAGRGACACARGREAQQFPHASGAVHHPPLAQAEEGEEGAAAVRATDELEPLHVVACKGKVRSCCWAPRAALLAAAGARKRGGGAEAAASGGGGTQPLGRLALCLSNNTVEVSVCVHASMRPRRGLGTAHTAAWSAGEGSGE